MHLTHPNFESIKVVKRFSATLIAVLLLCVAPSIAAAATTTLSSGTDPSSFTIAPGSTATSVDQFVFQTDTGSDTITAVTVSLPSVDAVSLLEIVNEPGSTVYGTTSTFSLNATTTGFESGNLGSFTAGGDVSFTATSTASNQGSWSAVSGLIGDDASSTLSYTKVFAGQGSVQFSYKVSSESGYDYLNFFIDGVLQDSWTGQIGWSTSTSYAVSAGTHTFMWSYTKDSCCTEGTDQVWIDDVVTSEGYVATISLSNATFAVSTSATTSKIRLTPKTHAALAPAAYTTGAFVSEWTGTNTKDGTDSSATVLSIDNVAPGVVTSASVTGGASATSTYTTPADTDLSRVVILRSESAVVDTPVDGTVYSVNDTIGAATVACVDTAITPSTSDECVTTGLSSTTPYYFKIFSVDLYGNYGSGVVPSGSPINIQPITVSGTLYADEGVTAITTGKTIKLAVGTSTTGIFTTTSNGSGAWSITLPAGHQMASGTPLVAFVDAGAGTVAAVAIKAKNLTSNITGLDLYSSRFVVSQVDTTSSPVHNSDLSFYDTDQDADTLFTSNGGVLEVQAGVELHVQTGKVFDPSGQVVIHGNAISSTIDGTLHLAPSATYQSSVVTKIAGNLFASSTASITGLGTILMTATTTGKVIMATSTSIGSVSFIGSGGVWTFGANATTTNLTIGSGASVTAPSGILTVQGSYINNGIFSHNSGTTTFRGVSESFAAVGAFGSAGTNDYASVHAVAVKGDYLYVGKYDDYTGPCIEIAGDAYGCELMVFDISSSTSFRFVAGRDQGGTAGGGSDSGTFRELRISGNYLFVGKEGDSTPCSQVPGSASGCEIQVYDISSSTNPVYVAGLDSNGSMGGSTGSSIMGLEVIGTMLYVGKNPNATACSQTAGSAIGCELMVFDISSSTNPVYVAGRDSSGSSNGTGYSTYASVEDFAVQGNYLYVGKGLDGTACSQTAGSAIGCELMVFDISSSTNPVYVAGRDVTGSVSGTGGKGVSSLDIFDHALYVGTDIWNAGACSQVAGSSINCELLVFDISSSTNPVYVAGRDMNGNADGNTTYFYTNGGVQDIEISGTTLYLGISASSVDCRQAPGAAEGCELQAYDISSSTNPVFVGARDSSGSGYGWTANGDADIYAIVSAQGRLFLGRDSVGYLCQNSVGYADACEIVSLSLPMNGSMLRGSMTGSSAWNAIDIVNGLVTFGSTATTSDLVIRNAAVMGVAAPLSIEKNLSSSGVVNSSSVTIFDGTGAQVISGSLTGLGGLGALVFRNAGTKSIASSASTSQISIDASSGSVSVSGVLSVDGVFRNDGTFIAPPVLLLNGDFVNTGTFTHNSGEVLVRGQSLVDMVVRDSSGSEGGSSDTHAWVMTANDRFLFVGMTQNPTACSQVAGSAGGCELQVYDISSSTNPVYVAGRDITGSTNGTGNQTVTSLVLHGDMLYVGQETSSTTCGQTAGAAIGCEIQVYDISSSTNPIYVAGRDLSGSADGVAWKQYYSIDTMTVANNMLYVGIPASSTPCSQVAGSAAGCELQVYDISSSTNPVYVAGRDADGSASGISEYYPIKDILARSGYLYLAVSASLDACGETPGNALGCELQVYDISSSTNPVYVAGRDADGSASGTTEPDFFNLAISGNSLYVTKYGDGSVCTNVVGSTLGCEFMVFDISSSTRPSYVYGWDVAGSPDGLGSWTDGVYSFEVFGDRLFAARYPNSTGCTQTPGGAIGCELQVYDISSTTRPVYAAGLDSSGTRDGNGMENFRSMAFSGSRIYIAKFGYSGACSVTNNINCNFLSFRLNNNLSGTMTGASAFYNLTIANTAASGSSSQAVFFKNVASSTGMFTMKAGSSVQFPANATSSFQDISLLGASGTPVYLRSSVLGTRAAFYVLGTQSQVNYADVRDNSACPTTITNTGGIDSGNTLCWVFVSGGTPTISLFAYLFRNDDAGESSATLHGTESSTSSDRVWKGDRLRLRLGISNTGTGAATNYQYRLQYSSTSCTVWSDVLPYASSSSLGEWKMDPSQWFTDGTLTQNLSIITDPNGKSFVPGELRFLSNLTGALTLSTSQFTELEYAISSTALVTPGAVYCFRLVDQSMSASFTYGVQPQILLTTRPRPQTGGAAIEGVGSGPIVTGGGASGGGASEGTGSGGAVGGGGAGGGGGLE